MRLRIKSLLAVAFAMAGFFAVGTGAASAANPSHKEYVYQGADYAFSDIGYDPCSTCDWFPRKVAVFDQECDAHLVRLNYRMADSVDTNHYIQDGTCQNTGVSVTWDHSRIYKMELCEWTGSQWSCSSWRYPTVVNYV